MSVSLAILRPPIAGSTRDNILGARWRTRSGQGQAAKESDDPEGSGSSRPAHGFGRL
jgi:hypothetical protein